MTNFFYTDTNGQKVGPVSEGQLRVLAAQGIIGQHTPLETDTGYQGVAGQIPGLFVAAPHTPSQTPVLPPYSQGHAPAPAPGVPGTTTASMILGIVSFFAACIPLFGFPVAITGLILGIKGLNREGHSTAQVGIVLNIIGLVLSVLSAFIGIMAMG